MLIAKTRNVKSPQRGTDRSAGLDFFVPEIKNNHLFLSDLLKKNPKLNIDDIQKRLMIDEEIVVGPHCHILIPSGIKINLHSVAGYTSSKHNGLAFIAMNKSSVGIMQLDVAATIVDEDYQGEIHLSVTNTSSEDVIINGGMKLVQFLLVPVFLDDVQEVSEDELFLLETLRGTNCFGSTGKF